VAFLDQQTKLGENLVLIGSTNYDYVESLKASIQNKGPVWSSWNFRIRNQWRSVIYDRIKTDGRFPLFFYLSKKLGGSGTIEDVAVVCDIRISDTPIPTPDRDSTNTGEENLPSDEFKSYTWFKHSSVDPIGPFDIRSFRDIDTEDPINPSQLIASFAYAFVADESELVASAEEVTVTPTSISVERDLRKYLVPNLNSLESGLTLYVDQERNGEEYPIEGGRMRIDILAKDATGNYVVIELKAGVADQSTFGQLSAYIGWIKKNLAKGDNVRGIIIANDFDDRIKYASQSVTNIRLKRYALEFKFNEENL
jgi:hypothetical protein